MKNQLTQFDRASVRSLADAIEQAVQAVGKEYGVEIKRGNGRFDAGSFKLTVNCTILAGAAERQKQEDREDFAYLCELYGLTADDYGRTFTSGSATYTVSAIKPKSKSYPIVCTRADGKRFKFPAQTVRSYLSASAS